MGNSLATGETLHVDVDIEAFQTKVKELNATQGKIETFDGLVVPNLQTCVPLSKSLIGGKAAHLATISCLPGVRVPAASVVTTAAFTKLCTDAEVDLTVFDNHKVGSAAPFAALQGARQALLDGKLELGAELESLLDKNKKYSVRSSGSSEDSQHASFAGMMKSVLNVEGNVEAITEAIVSVFVSTFEDATFLYWNKHRSVGKSQTYPRMAVLIQEQVDSRSSAVVFTQHPSSEDNPNRMLVEACRGQGAGIADGTASTDSFVIDKAKKTVVSATLTPKQFRMELGSGEGGVEVIEDPEAAKEGAEVTPELSLEELAKVVGLAFGLEEVFGGAQDIELCFDQEGNLNCLQSRAVTSYASSYKPEIKRKGCWELESAHFGKPVPKLAGYYIMGMMDGLFQRGLRLSGTLLEVIDVEVTEEGWVYCCPRPVGAPEEPTAAPPKMVLKMLQAFHPEMRLRNFNAKKMIEGRTWKLECKEFHEKHYPSLIQKNIDLGDKDLEAMNDSELLEHVKATVENAREMLNEHHHYSIQCLVPVGRFLHYCQAKWEIGNLDALRLLCGTSPASMSSLALHASTVREAALKYQDALAIINKDGAGQAELDALLNRDDDLGEALTEAYNECKYRVLGGYTHLAATIFESPELFMSHVREAVNMPDHETTMAKAKVEMEKKRDEKVPEAEREFFSLLFEDACEMYPVRDLRALCSDSMGLGILRLALLEAGKRCKGKGLIDDPVDIMFVDRDELEHFITGTEASDEKKAVLKDRRFYQESKTWQDAARFVGPRAGPPPDPEILTPNCKEIAYCMGATMGNLFTPGTEIVKDENTIQGVPGGASGIYEGSARTIKRENDIGKVKAGEVLIVTATSTAYNSVIAKCGAVVAEVGGILSHAAITSRENGKPCVMKAAHALKLITTGDLVRVDGNQGTVEIISRDNSRLSLFGCKDPQGNSYLGSFNDGVELGASEEEIRRSLVRMSIASRQFSSFLSAVGEEPGPANDEDVFVTQETTRRRTSLAFV